MNPIFGGAMGEAGKQVVARLAAAGARVGDALPVGGPEPDQLRAYAAELKVIDEVASSPVLLDAMSNRLARRGHASGPPAYGLSARLAALRQPSSLTVGEVVFGGAVLFAVGVATGWTLRDKLAGRTW